MGKRYESDIAHTRRVIHRLADEIILKMTGESGMSSSRLVFTSDRTGGRELYQIDFDGADLTRLTEDRSLVISPAVSPDGQKNLIYTSYKENNPDLYLMSVEDRKTDVSHASGIKFCSRLGV